MLELLGLHGTFAATLLGLSWAPPLAPAPAALVERAAEPQKIALLVGIDRYAPGTPSTFQRLSGCVRDVQLVRGLLVDRFDFPGEEVLVLANEEATHEGIVRAFHERLIERAGPATEVLIWFSGHGSRVPDRSGAAAAEIEGKDSTLLAYDSRAKGEDGAFDVSDDEVDSLLAALTEKTKRVTVVTDACHSGGATRGIGDQLGVRVRGVADGGRPVDRARLEQTFWPKEIPLLDDAAPAMRGATGYVHIAACAPTQLAVEIDVEGDDGTRQSHGALTFFLVQRLRDTQPGTSYRRIADDVSVRVSTSCPAQTVWAEGALSRELFGAAFQPRPIGFRARAERIEAQGGHRVDVRVDAGSVHGLRVRSVLALHAGEDLVGRAEVLRIHAASSLARWIDPAPDEIPAGSLRAIEETRPADEEPLSLHVPDPAIAALLAKSERVRIVPDAAEYTLLAGEDGKLALYGPGSVRLWRERERLQRGNGELASRLEEEFREELRYRALVGLSSEKGSLHVAARFASPEPAELERFEPGYERRFDATPRVEAIGSGSPAGSVYRAQGTTALEVELSLAMLVVENKDSKPLHVSILSVSEDRERHAIWPREGEKDRVLPPGESVRVPVNVVVSPEWAEPRPMRDRYLVLATLEPADFTPLARERTTRGEAPAIRMPPILALALERPRTRGFPQASTNRSGYGLCVVDLHVEPIAKR
ncbi:MAG: caspase domain-containing protein [Planctomycetota bacterium]